MTERNIKYYHQLLKPFIEYPDQKMADDIILEFNQTTGLPPGKYGIFIQSNEVLKRMATAKSHKGTITGKTILW
ncbi:hypothetical protein [Bacillus sp. JJ1764]|uniref:hypothetical protein n=1 Tax=Bacillus sp. JJ1764 TaxID=3122964 RepID=UPI002FFEF028